jgi:hypothetical protein
MEVRIKLEGVEQALKRYNHRQVLKAVNFALRRAVKSGKTAASDEIRNTLGFNIMKSDLDRKITITTRPLEGEITVAGKPIILSYFKPEQIESGIRKRIIKRRGRKATAFEIKQSKTKLTGSGVYIEIVKGRRTLLRGGKITRMGIKVAGVFIGRGKGGTPLVFGRIAKSRKLIAMKVYSEHFMFKKTLNRVAKRVVEQWEKEWANQIKHLQSGTATWVS